MRKIELILVVLSLVCGLAKTSAQEVDTRGFNLIVVGDPQPQTEEQLGRLESEIMPHIATIVERYKAESDLPTAILLTGDVVWDTMSFLPRVKALFEGLGVDVYAVMGNHDHDRQSPRNERVAESHYVQAFGPKNYAVAMGQSLLIGLDNIGYRSYEDYTSQVDLRQRRWLRSVVRQTDEEKRLVVAMHAPAVDFRNGCEPQKYTRKLLRILKGRRVNFITGHRHRHAIAEIAEGVMEISVSQVNGNLWFAPLCGDGMPRAVLCIEERDGEWQWHYDILGRESNNPIYLLSDEHSREVVIKVAGWEDAWRVEWTEDGESKGAMEQFTMVDPEYMHYVEQEANYSEVIMQRLRRSAMPRNHYFRCTPSDGATSVTINVTDRFGRVYSHTVD